MVKLSAVEAKAFVPAKDFDLSKRFYEELGFTCAWSDADLAYFHCDGAAFLLQRFYVAAHADNFMMHLLVENADAWWAHVGDRQLAARYGVHAEPPADRPWRMRDFVLVDPTGVLWRIGHNL